MDRFDYQSKWDNTELNKFGLDDFKNLKGQKISKISDVNFKRVMNEIMKVDKDIKAGDGRLRDFLLMDLAARLLIENKHLSAKN